MFDVNGVRKLNGKLIQFKQAVEYASVEDIKKGYVDGIFLDNVDVNDISDKNEFIKKLDKVGFIKDDTVVIPKDIIMRVVNVCDANCDGEVTARGITLYIMLANLTLNKPQDDEEIEIDIIGI